MSRIEELRKELYDLRDNGAEIEDIAQVVLQIQLEEKREKERLYKNE